MQNPSYFNPSISYHIEQAIIKGMALDPRDRPQYVRSWLRLLNKNNRLAVDLEELLQRNKRFNRKIRGNE